MPADDIEDRIVRYADLKPCKAAFIDAHTPGSDQKENFAIIGGGVSENPEQYVHIPEPHGFNIGAAGQPSKCRNSLHDHFTAEVFFVLSSRWRFFWGRWGDAGEVVLEPGDIFNIPTGMFRGFENIGSDYGMIMAILGGDDAGGGVVWAPQVIEDAAAHGLMLAENGRLYDSRKGEALPDGVDLMPLMSDRELAKRLEPTTFDVLPNCVARYWDMVALADRSPIRVIGDKALLHDRPGFEVEFLAGTTDSSCCSITSRPSVLMPVKGHWDIRGDWGSVTLAAGDTMSMPLAHQYEMSPATRGEAALYRVVATDDPAGSTSRHCSDQAWHMRCGDIMVTE